ncbi:hypothetical protein [Saccharopolyspora flava]|nr:hypothetical protein [Saccharopolyspora flava]
MGEDLVRLEFPRDTVERAEEVFWWYQEMFHETLTSDSAEVREAYEYGWQLTQRLFRIAAVELFYARPCDCQGECPPFVAALEFPRSWVDQTMRFPDCEPWEFNRIWRLSAAEMFKAIRARVTSGISEKERAECR